MAAMAAATLLAVVASLQKSLPRFLVGFIALFALSGLANGSRHKMIPGIFQAMSAADAAKPQRQFSYAEV
jgi:MFS transporter, NNP family, nitrate/nitrite transporter